MRAARSHAPLAGARLFVGDEVVATTDADGRARLRLDAWPELVRVAAEGYEDAAWYRDTLLHEARPTLWLDDIK